VLYDQYQITYNAEHYRLRCNGHIINLTAQAFLFHLVDEALANHNNTNNLVSPTEAEMELWRKKGPLGKLHNIVVYIQRSTQRMASFRELSQGRNLSRDNATRWNSWHRMLCTANKLRAAIDVYCAQYQENTADTLSAKDWRNLQKIEDFLLFFHAATLSTESRGATIERVLPTMDFLLEQFEQGKTLYADDPFMGPCCNSRWAKLDKYYSLTDRSPVYITALVLCPQNKWQYMDDNWPTEWIIDAKTKVQMFWELEYKSTATIVLVPAPESTPRVQNPFAEWHKKKQRSRLDIDEYAKYLQAPVLPEVKDARSWWLEPTQRNSYPALSIMALDILSIPAMSAELERLFSGAKVTITERRNQLGIESIQAIECLKSWLGNSSSTTWVDEEVGESRARTNS
jgi:hypothetical protein